MNKGQHNTFKKLSPDFFSIEETVSVFASLFIKMYSREEISTVVSVIFISGRLTVTIFLSWSTFISNSSKLIPALTVAS